MSYFRTDSDDKEQHYQLCQKSINLFLKHLQPSQYPVLFAYMCLRTNDISSSTTPASILDDLKTEFIHCAQLYFDQCSDGYMTLPKGIDVSSTIKLLECMFGYNYSDIDKCLYSRYIWAMQNKTNQ